MIFKKLFFLFLIFVLPLTVFVKWKSLDNSYSTDDQSAYLELSQELYINFKTDSPANALKEMYLHKHWKPIFHPLILVPFLALTDGDTRQAISLYGGLLYSLIIFIVYLFLSRYLGFDMTVLATSAIALTPWLFGISTSFNSEIGFVACIVLLFFVLYQHYEYDRIVRCVLASLLLTLAFCCRPVEAALFTLVGLTYTVITAYQKRKIGLFDLGLVVVFCLYFVVVITLPFIVLKHGWSNAQIFSLSFVALVYFVLIVYAKPRHQNSRNFRVFYGLFFLISIIWFSPGALQLMDWILVANFKYIAMETGNRLNSTLFSFFAFYMQKLGVLTTLLFLVYCFDNRFDIKKIVTRSGLLLCFGLILFPLLGGIVSYNGDVRYYYSGWIILTMVLFSQVLRKDRGLFALRYVFMLFLVSSALLILIGHVRDGRLSYPLSKLQILLGESFFDLAPKESEPYIRIQKTLAEELRHKNRATNRVVVLQRPYQSLDASTLNIITRERSEPWQFEMISYYHPTNLADVYGMLNRFDFIIVGLGFVETDSTIVATRDVANELAAICDMGGPIENPDLSHFKLVGKLNFDGAAIDFGQQCLFENSRVPPVLRNRH